MARSVRGSRLSLLLLRRSINDATINVYAFDSKFSYLIGGDARTTAQTRRLLNKRRRRGIRRSRLPMNTSRSPRDCAQRFPTYIACHRRWRIWNVSLRRRFFSAPRTYRPAQRPRSPTFRKSHPTHAWPAASLPHRLSQARLRLIRRRLSPQAPASFRSDSLLSASLNYLYDASAAFRFRQLPLDRSNSHFREEQDCSSESRVDLRGIGSNS